MATMSQTSSASLDPISLNILAFGDSLTAGYHGRLYHPVLGPNRSRVDLPPAQFHPYASRLNELIHAYLQQHYPEQNVIASVFHSGHSGVHARDLLPLLKEKISDKSSDFHILIFLAGTNDLIGNREPLPTDPKTIFKYISDAHKFAHAHGVCSIVVTLPQIDWSNFPPISVSNDILASRRIELNDMLRSFARKQPAGLCALVDLAELIPFPALSSASNFDSCSSSMSATFASSSISSSSPTKAGISASGSTYNSSSFDNCSTHSSTSTSASSESLSSSTALSLPSVQTVVATNSDSELSFWDDHIHFSPSGYDRMADFMLSAVKQLLDHLLPSAIDMPQAQIAAQ